MVRGRQAVYASASRHVTPLAVGKSGPEHAVNLCAKPSAASIGCPLATGSPRIAPESRWRPRFRLPVKVAGISVTEESRPLYLTSVFLLGTGDGGPPAGTRRTAVCLICGRLCCSRTKPLHLAPAPSLRICGNKLAPPGAVQHTAPSRPARGARSCRGVPTLAWRRNTEEWRQ